MRTFAILAIGVLTGGLAGTRADDKAESDVIEFITKSPGGGYIRDEKLPGNPVTWVSIQQIDAAGLDRLRQLSALRHMDLSRLRITDGDMDKFESWPDLKSLVFQDIKITDAGLVHLGALKKLESLILTGTPDYRNGPEGLPRTHRSENALPRQRSDQRCWSGRNRQASVSSIAAARWEPVFRQGIG